MVACALFVRQAGVFLYESTGVNHSHRGGGGVFEGEKEERHSVFLYMCVCVKVWQCMCAWVCVCVCVYMCVRVRTCASVSVYKVCTSECVSSRGDMPPWAGPCDG